MDTKLISVEVHKLKKYRNGKHYPDRLIIPLTINFDEFEEYIKDNIIGKIKCRTYINGTLLYHIGLDASYGLQIQVYTSKIKTWDIILSFIVGINNQVYFNMSDNNEIIEKVNLLSLITLYKMNNIIDDGLEDNIETNDHLFTNFTMSRIRLSTEEIDNNSRRVYLKIRF